MTQGQRSARQAQRISLCHCSSSATSGSHCSQPQLQSQIVQAITHPYVVRAGTEVPALSGLGGYPWATNSSLGVLSPSGSEARLPLAGEPS